MNKKVFAFSLAAAVLVIVGAVIFFVSKAGQGRGMKLDDFYVYEGGEVAKELGIGLFNSSFYFAADSLDSGAPTTKRNIALGSTGAEVIAAYDGAFCQQFTADGDFSRTHYEVEKLSAMYQEEGEPHTFELTYLRYYVNGSLFDEQGFYSHVVHWSESKKAEADVRRCTLAITVENNAVTDIQMGVAAGYTIPDLVRRPW